MKLPLGICIFSAVLALSGCGKKEPVENAATNNSSSEKAEKAAPVLSVEKSLTQYALVDFGGDIDKKKWDAFRSMYMRTLAAVPELDDKTLASAAFVDVGSEPDAFKRDDLFKSKSADLAALRKNDVSKIHLAWGMDKDKVTATVSNYDMSNEAYTITISGLTEYGVFFSWDEASVSSRFGYHTEIAGLPRNSKQTANNDFQVVKKVPKEQARAIEASLAPLRQSGDAGVRMPVSVYATIGKTESAPTWNTADIAALVDAIAIHLPKTSTAQTFMLIDGPEIKRPEKSKTQRMYF